MRTFTRAQLDEANAAWSEGGFSPEWREVRHKAAMGGLIFPPSGSAWDSWEDASPSQRAILIRAIREMPGLLDRCLIGAPSWHVVIARLTRARDHWRDELAAKDRHAKREHERENPTPREAVMSIGAVIERIRDSVA